MSLKPWREIAQPHKDVLEGSFKQSEFAADITQVANGTAPTEYQDAEKFFSRTYITEGMRLLLISVAQRLAGQGGDPVIQLQTAFGGGKTHTMLAVYHMANSSVSTDKLMGIPSILDDAGVSRFPRANVAVIDGIRQSPSQPSKYGALQVKTLWGELAYQLLGEEGYSLVEKSDNDGTSPGKEILKELLTMAAPCVILIDELLAYIRQFELGNQYNGGTFDSNISFIQALTEALKAVPNAILLASLPESELEIGGTMGQRALSSLEKYFARVESVWKPVGARESFEIVRRRLFESPGERSAVEGISRQFSDFYRKHAEKFPLETQSNEYYERLCASYPIHPEVFDRLYEDWSTLEKFQRTRGVLQFMAIVIHRLWNSDNRDALIMPGSLPLDDVNVRNKSIHYLPVGWEPIIEKEIDGLRSIPAEIDGRNTRFGGVQAAQRAARTLFLGSAPSTQAQANRGIQTERVLLGAIQPNQITGTFEDVLRYLRDRLHYLYSEQDRFWFDTKPNLRREMESRKQNISERDELIPLLKERVTRLFGRNHHFAGIHIFTPSADVPDDYNIGPRLVVLPVHASYSRNEVNSAYSEAEKIVRNRGEQPRQKQNRLIFLAPDFDVVSRLKEQGRTYLAWHSIATDIDNGTLNQDVSHFNQAKNNRDSAEQSLGQFIRQTWKWLIAPVEDFVKGRPELRWESVSVSPSAQNLIQAIEETLKEEEWIIYEWSPIHLRKILSDWYFKEEVKEISALKVWQDSCHYLYLPRLVNDDVFKNTLAQGLESEDYFGFAAGKENERYLGFAFGKRAPYSLDETSLLIEREKALEYKQQLQDTTKNLPVDNGDDNGSKQLLSGRSYDVANEPKSAQAAVQDSGEATNASDQNAVEGLSKRFYGTVSLDPVRAQIEFADIMAEVVQQFSSRLGVEVSISVEIEAQKSDGFSLDLQRIIKENSNTLKFKIAEFEKE